MKVQSVRATVKIGTTEIKTPYVKAFTITRQRGVLWASASVTIEASAREGNTGRLNTQLSGDNIQIYAKVDDSNKLLFTGYVDTLDITPSMSECGGILVNLTAYDKLYKLRLLKINRRIQTSPGELWCAITGVSRKCSSNTSNRFKPGDWSTKIAVSGNSGDPNYDPLSAEAKADLSTSEKRATNEQQSAGADAPPGGIHPGESVPWHTHAGFDHGGPALGVFGDYKLYEEGEEEE